MSTKYLLCVLLLLLINFSFAEHGNIVTFTGENSQGSIMFGKVASNVERLFLGADELNINENNLIISFDRDAELSSQLLIILNDGSSYNIPLHINTRNYQIDRIENLQKGYVAGKSDPEWIKRVNQEEENLTQAWKKIYKGKTKYYTDFIRPVEGGWISSEFGSQRILNGVPKRPHNGTDIAVPKGTEIKAMSDGVVVLTGDYYYNGRFVLIDHGDGLGSLYAHLDTIMVEKGQYVTPESIIGKVGSTGRSTGPHLHWGVMHHGNRIDPLSLINNNNEAVISIRFE